jgi:hypothetical protein
MELKPERGGGGGERIDSRGRDGSCGNIIRDIKYDGVGWETIWVVV